MNKMPVRDFKQALKQYVRLSVVTLRINCAALLFGWLLCPVEMNLIPFLYSSMLEGNNEQ